MRYTKGVPPHRSKNVNEKIVIRKKTKAFDWSLQKGEVLVVKDDINYRQNDFELPHDTLS
jgi:hypothetical protein